MDPLTCPPANSLGVRTSTMVHCLDFSNSSMFILIALSYVGVYFSLAQEDMPKARYNGQKLIVLVSTNMPPINKSIIASVPVMVCVK